jgi:hypothetical protein
MKRQEIAEREQRLMQERRDLAEQKDRQAAEKQRE